MKICPKCNIDKEDQFFGKKKTGLRSWCKVCESNSTKAWIKKNKEHVDCYALKYRKSENRKIVRKRAYEKEKALDPNFQKKIYWNKSGLREKKIALVKAWREKNPHMVAEHARQQRQKNPLKCKARRKLGDFVRRGRIEKPNICSKCNMANIKLEGHHEDYTKPLEVIWLCVACHNELHLNKGV